MRKKVGDRFNKGKLRWRNVPLFLLRPIIEVGHYGETKYKLYNFLEGQSINTLLDSIKRHLDDFEDFTKPDYDLESKKHSLAHVAWNCIVAIYMLKTRPDLDDRYKGPKKSTKRRKKR